MAKQLHTTPLAAAYARSVLEIANDRGIAPQTGEELRQVAEIVGANPDFKNFLASPSISEVERGQLVEKTFRGRASELVVNALIVMNRKGRLGMIDEIAQAYNDMLQAQQGIVEVDVIVAERLTPDQLEQVRQRVGQALKREVVLHQYQDASIIGGLVLRVQDRLLDASVRAQLRAVRRLLLAARPR